MQEINPKQQKILQLLLQSDSLSSSETHSYFLKAGDNLSLITIKRELSQMVRSGFITPAGQGRSRNYTASALGRMFTKIDATTYCATPPDKRYGLPNFNFNILPALSSDIFTATELESFKNSTEIYRERTTALPAAIEKRELERLIIELSWKSSKIEGNTYTLLDTEKLILENKEAPGHDKKEAVMILNHKDAFSFVREEARSFRALTPANLEHLHGILIKDLGVGVGFRQKPVGVLGSKYRPLDNIYQIQEAVNTLIETVNKIDIPQGKALTALLGLSYIQPFEDGNKRTARLLANALLLAYECAPLSYRSVDEKEYREAMLVFYELNSIVPFKNIFVDQYKFAAENYAVK
jgi:Fic family protein